MRHVLPLAWWILFLNALLSIWNLGIIWFVQIAVYPLWQFVGPKEFGTYHLKWWPYMQPTFVPVGLMLLCSVALLFCRLPGVAPGLLWLGMGLQVAVHLLTILYWAPIQASLASPNGMSPRKYSRLMKTHWGRVALFAALALLMVWAVCRSISSMM